MRGKRIQGKRYSLRYKKNKSKSDLALIVSEIPANAALYIQKTPLKVHPLLSQKGIFQTDGLKQ